MTFGLLETLERQLTQQQRIQREVSTFQVVFERCILLPVTNDMPVQVLSHLKFDIVGKLASHDPL
jgi:hypothetical protein